MKVYSLPRRPYRAQYRSCCIFSEQKGTRNATQKVPLLICYLNKSGDIKVTREAAGSHLGKYSHVYAKAT